MNTIISVTDFIRNFGDYTKILPEVEKLVLTRDGRPFAEVKIVPEEKNKKLLTFFGLWKGTDLDDDKLWKNVLIRKNRKKPIKL